MTIRTVFSAVLFVCPESDQDGCGPDDLAGPALPPERIARPTAAGARSASR